jgi:hypothetical protein
MSEPVTLEDIYQLFRRFRRRNMMAGLGDTNSQAMVNVFGLRSVSIFLL